MVPAKERIVISKEEATGRPSNPTTLPGAPREGKGIEALYGFPWFPTLLGIAELATHLMAAGAMLFYTLTVRPLQRSLGPSASAAAPVPSSSVSPKQETASLALRGAVAALLSFLFRLPEPWFQAASLTGSPPSQLLLDPVVSRIVTDTRFGQIWILLQGGALVLTALLVQVALRLRAGHHPGLWLPLSWAASLALAVLPAWKGHAGTHGTLALLNHAVHWLAATLWIGGLFHLIWMVFKACGKDGSTASSDGSAGKLANGMGPVGLLAQAFSPLALVGLLWVLGTGGINAWLYVPEVSYLTDSSYGLWLSAKLALVAAVVALGTYNGLVLVPSLNGRRTPDEQQRPRIEPLAVRRKAAARQVLQGRFRKTLAAEGALALAVLAATHGLARQPPVYQISFAHLGQTGRFTLGLLGPVTFLGVFLTVAGVSAAVLAWRSLARAAFQLPARAVRLRVLAIALAASLTIAGSGLTVYSLLIPRTPWTAEFNPLPPTPEAVELGRKTYESYCTLCHGPRGEGDGPLAPALSPAPGDLTAPYTRERTDGDLMWLITEGIPPNMPGFPFLTETERWSLVHYLRTLQR